MKKIDFHLHTVPTVRDSTFNFSLDVLNKYTSECSIDAIAITNHDIFDKDQYQTIVEELQIPVYPGIEVSLDNGHLLIIGERASIDDFQDRASHVTAKINHADDTISITELKEIFPNLGEYLVIPHYEKKPAIGKTIISEISEEIVAGEVDSAKKFIRAIKDDDKLTPVLFSDVRIDADLVNFPTRQTYLDCGDISIDAIKTCLKDKNKVALTREDGNTLFQIFDDGLKISTGLNVLVGERSTGKTFTLDKIYNTHHKVKYIRQFDLVQKDEEESKREFDQEVQRQRSLFVENYLTGLKSVLDDVINVDLRVNDQAVNRYVESLLRSAAEEDRKDAFSKTILFDEPEFQVSEGTGLKELIESVRHIIENVEFREIITKHVDLAAVKNIAIELIDLLWLKSQERKKQMTVNSIMRDVRENLQMRTSAVRIEDVDLYRIAIETKKVDRFTEIVKSLQQQSVISEETVRGFRVRANKTPFSGASELKKAIRTSEALSTCFSAYDEPYEYLQKLKEHEGLTPSEFYRLFVKISYLILNKDGYIVSGGERSEFRLLQEIKDAQNYDMLLIDEPESSFDNLFLKSDVNQIIKEISLSMPVVVVTHNNTVGASVGADFVLYTTKDYNEDRVVYRV
jgi:hypothetical protein